MSRILVLILFVQIFAACRTSKSLVVNKKLTTITFDQLTNKVAENQNFNFFSAKGKISYSDADFSGEADATLKVFKDSFAVLTIKKFGIELFRILINQDSVTALDRIQHTWQRSSISEWSSSFSVPIDFIMMQDIITSGFYLTDYLVYDLKNIEKLYQVEGSSELFLMNTSFFYAPLQSSEIKIIQSNKTAYVHFVKHISLDKKLVPSEINIRYVGSNQVEEKLIHIAWKEIHFNPIDPIKFEIPKSYTPL